MKRRQFAIGVRFEPRDVWLGVYVKKWRKRYASLWNGYHFHATGVETTIYVCILPMFPIRLDWLRILDEGSHEL